MRDFDTVQLRKQAADSARRTRRYLRLGLLAANVLLFLLALGIFATMVVGMPWIFDALWMNIDVSLIVVGLFAGWGIGIALHGATVVVDSDWAERQLRQRAAAGALGRALLDDADADYPSEWMKTKRDVDDESEFGLSDDGELVTEEAEDNSPAQRMH